MSKKSKQPVRRFYEGDVVGDYGPSLNAELSKSSITADNNATEAANVLAAEKLMSEGYGDYGNNTGAGGAGTTLYGTTSGNFDNVKNFTDASGKVDWGKFAVAAGGLYGALNPNKGMTGGAGSGYQGGIPTLYAGRNMLLAPPTSIGGVARRPGSGGINYGGDVTYFNTKKEVDEQKAAMDAYEAARAATITTPATTTTTPAATTAISGLTSSQLASLTTSQLATLSSSAVSNLTSSQLAALSTSQLAALSTSQLSTLSTSQLAALSTSAATNLSTSAVKALTPAQVNANIVKWVTEHPYATNAEIQAAQTGSKTNDEQIAAALRASGRSEGAIWAITHDMGLDKLYQNINKFVAAQAADTTTPAYQEEFSRRAAMQASGVTDADIKAAAAYAQREKEIFEWNKMYAPELNNTATTVTEKAPDLNASIAAILADKKTDTPNMNSSLSAILAERKAATETPNMESSLSAILADRKASESAPDLTSSLAAILADRKTSGIQLNAGGGIAMAKGRYLQGETDGMADELPAQIGQDQPAALSHGEFVVPADVVSHLGNGNSDAGAKKLYQMMDKIRMARTGNKKQGKKINPEKFMPGGLASLNYSNGGAVKHFVEGGKTVPPGTTGIESNLSNWAGPYVTNMLGQGQALANMPYQPYLGPLTAGMSPLQATGFTTASALKTPSSIGDAATQAGSAATAAGKLTYSPTTSFSNQYTNPGSGTATTFNNQYTAPIAYSPTTSSFDSAQAKTYMNPYLEQSLTPQLEEARRQSGITQQQNDARMTQGGAYGGGRNAIMNAETQRNLGTNLANITGAGYNTAFTNAQSQFNAEQNRKMQEAQFGAQQGASAAQLEAQYGLSSDQATEMARQFGIQQGMTAAGNTAQYGLASQQAAEQSKQYGAGYGLDALKTQLAAAQAQGQFGLNQNQANLSNLQTQLDAGNMMRGIESEGIAADRAQFEEARNNPFKMVQFQQSLLQGMPTSSQAYNTAPQSSLVSAAQSATTIDGLLRSLGLIKG